MKQYIKLFTFTAVLVASFALFTGASSALTGTDFRPGRIIDDVIFTNKSSMSVAQIQQFLESKVAGGSCDTSGTRPSTRWYTAAGRYYTHAEWGALNANPAPFVCLTTYKENPTTKQTNLGNPTLVIAGAQTAAEIIYNAGQQYNINPQTLLVLLQKEQSLITDDWPWLDQYAKATGAYCPDTAPCDAAQAGFGTQVREAARLFRYYMDTPWLYFVGNNYVLYNPNTACGGTTVYIENKATEALYHYTPYQPNAAALSNLYGTGDGCSAYGNRNFWRMFNDWFGNTIGPGYSYVTAVNPPAILYSNQIVVASVSIRNDTSLPWYSDGNVPVGEHPTRLAMLNYKDSPLANIADPAWLGTRNQIKMKESSVGPGGIATFEATFLGPLVGVRSRMEMTPVIDGVKFMPFIGMAWAVETPTLLLNYQVTSITGLEARVNGDAEKQITVLVKNIGTTYWYKDGASPLGAQPLRMLTAEPFYHLSGLATTGWLAKNQIPMQNNTVAPGETATFIFGIHTPTANGFINEKYSLVLDGKIVMPLNGQLQISSEVIDYRAFLLTENIPSNMIPGKQYTVSVSLRNDGSSTWYNESNVPTGGHPFRLVANSYAGSIFADTSDPAWLNTQNQIKMKTAVVNPGETAEFEFRIIAPYKRSFENLALRPVVDGLRVMDQSVSKIISIPQPIFSYGFVDSVNPPSIMQPTTESTARVRLTNVGNTVWYNDTSRPTSLRYGAARLIMALPYYRNSAFASSSDPAWLNTQNQIKMKTAVVNPGETAEFEFIWKAPVNAGTYADPFSVVIDGYVVIPFIGLQYNTRVQ